MCGNVVADGANQRLSATYNVELWPLPLPLHTHSHLNNFDTQVSHLDNNPDSATPQLGQKHANPTSRELMKPFSWEVKMTQTSPAAFAQL